MANGEDPVPLLLQACREAMLYFEAPAGSPRHWPVARANLYDLLKRAVAAGSPQTGRRFIPDEEGP